MASYAFDLIGTVFENVFKIVQHNPDTRHVLSILMSHQTEVDFEVKIQMLQINKLLGGIAYGTDADAYSGLERMAERKDRIGAVDDMARFFEQFAPARRIFFMRAFGYDKMIGEQIIHIAGRAVFFRPNRDGF